MSSIADQTPYNEHTGNGVATAYGFEFEITVATQLKVKVDGALVSSADYTVSGVGVQAGGTVTFDTAPDDGAEILIYRNTALARTTSYTTNGPFTATTVNKDFNYLWMVLQEILTGLRRDAGALRVPFPGSVNDLPTLTELRDRVLAFNETTGQPEASSFTMTQVASVIAAVYAAAAGPLDALSFIQAGDGAASRSPQAKLREVAVSLVDYGADPTGVSDINSALDDAVTYLASVGGGTIYGRASDTYNLATDYSITDSNITIDLRGGKLIGVGWLKFDGSGAASDNVWGGIEKVHFKNARIGAGAGSTTKAPFFLFCADSTMDNVYRHSYGDTGFNMFMCKRTHFRRIVSQGGKNTGAGSFAGLMLHCIDSTFEDAVALEGPFKYVWQIKGGENCKGIRCIGRDIAASGTVSTDYGFFIRGDDPWGASPTTGYPYPYPTGSWGAADEQRASRACYFEDSWLVNTPCTIGVFYAQEFVGAGFRKCHDVECTGAGFAGSKVLLGSERDFEVSDCVGYRSDQTLPGAGVTAASSAATNMPGVKIRRNRVEGYGYSGVYVKSADAVVSENTATNCCGNGSVSHQAAFNAITNSKVDYSGNEAIDNRGTKSHVYGFLADSTCEATIAERNRVEGFTGRMYAISLPARYNANSPGELSTTTTSGTAVTTSFITAPKSGKSMWIEATVTGTSSAAVVGVWKIGGLFVNNAGTVSQQGSTASLITAINPGAWTGVSFTVVSNTVRISIAGAAATTINWTGSVRCETA